LWQRKMEVMRRGCGKEVKEQGKGRGGNRITDRRPSAILMYSPLARGESLGGTHG